MSWTILCYKENCEESTTAENIVDLINNYRNKEGWLVCKCGSLGYIRKSFDLQEKGEVWEPYLRGIITLDSHEATYHPFVFIVSYKPNGPCKDIWFSYYKDLRAQGGRLKLGYGPGGPPVLDKQKIKKLFKKLIKLKYLSYRDIKEIIETN